MSSRYQTRAQREAAKLLERYGTSVPVDVLSIAKDCGLTVRKEDLEEEVSGMLVIRDDNAVVGVNKNHHPNRQRFTAAHELGHYLLHGKAAHIFVDASPVFFRDEQSSEGTKTQEIVANTFAAELLMPEAALKEILSSKPVDIYDEDEMADLAKRLKVSVQALTIRLAKLGLVSV